MQERASGFFFWPRRSQRVLIKVLVLSQGTPCPPSFQRMVVPPIDDAIGCRVELLQQLSSHQAKYSYSSCKYVTPLSYVLS